VEGPYVLQSLAFWGQLVVFVGDLACVEDTVDVQVSFEEAVDLDMTLEVEPHLEEVFVSGDKDVTEDI
jgi:hypothetical protein